MRASRWVAIAAAAATALVLIPSGVYRPDAKELLLTTWGMPREDALFRDLYAARFESTNPGWSMRYMRHNEIVAKYKAWHVQGRGADVMRVPITNYHEMVALGIVEPLDAFMDDPETGLSAAERADFFPAIWEALRLDGKRWGLPADNAQYGLYYNRAIFDEFMREHPEAGLTYPSADWTWEDLKRAADLLTVREDGRLERYGLAFDLWAWPFFAFLKQAGGEIWDEARTTTRVNSPAGVAALEFLASLVPPEAPARSAEMKDSAASPAEQFKIGKVAMLLDGSWRAPNLEWSNPDLDFAISPLPRGEERAIVGGAVLWCVGARSEHKERAWEMVKWITGREGSLLYWDTLRVAPPARISVVESDEFCATEGLVDPVTGERRGAMPEELFDERAKWLRDSIEPLPETGRSPIFVPVAPYQADLERVLSRAIVAAVRGEQSAKAALDDAARRVHEIIDRDRAAKGRPRVDRGS